MLIKDVLDLFKHSDLETNLKFKKLICYYNHIELNELYLNLQNEFNPKISLKKIKKAYNKINLGYPIEYLTHYKYFFGTKIFINHHVLVPRNETEQLVEKCYFIIKNNFQNQEINLLDLCCGSGALGISLANKLKKVKNIYFLDNSKKCLRVAKFNALNYRQFNSFFLKKDILKNKKIWKKFHKFNVIISNPPYINPNLSIDKSIKYEPKEALFTKDSNDIIFYQKILEETKILMETSQKPFLLAFEIGYDQKEKLESFLLCKNIKKYQFQKDIEDNWRFLFIWKNLNLVS